MRTALWILLGAIVLVVGGALGVFYLTPSSTVTSAAAQSVREQTGRELVIEGPIERSLFPSVRFSVGKMRLSNAEWAEAPDMISADGASIGLKFWALLGGAVEVTELTLVNPVVRLERRADGVANWDDLSGGAADASSETGRQGLAGDAAVTDQTSAPPPVSIANARITGGAFYLTDASSGQTLEMTEITLEAALEAVDAPLTLAGSALVNGRRATLDGRLDNLAALNAGRPATTRFGIDGEGADLSVDASFEGLQPGGAPSARGEIAARIEADPKQTEWLRDALGDAFKDLGAVDLGGQFDASKARLAVDLGGAVEFKGEPTQVRLKADAGEGWLEGRTTAALDFSVAGRWTDVGYQGEAGLTPEGAVLVRGDYRARVDDVGALIAFLELDQAVEGAPLRRIERVDLRGSAAIDGAGAAVDAAGDIGFGGRVVAATGALKGGADWLQGGALDIAATARSGGVLDAAWTGRLATVAGVNQVTGDIRLASDGLRALAAWLEAGPIPAPKGSFERGSLSARISAQPTYYSVEDLALSLDDMTAAGAGSLSVPSGRAPKMVARLSTSALDLRPFTGEGASGGGSGAGDGSGRGGGRGGAQGWSEEPLQLGFLKLIDADLSIETEGLATNVVRLGPSVFAISLADGQLDFAIRRSVFYGGSLTGSARLDGSGDTPATALDVKMSGVSLRPFAGDAAKIDWIEGTGALTIDVTSRGPHMRALMGGLGGSASMRLTDGAITGYNLAALVRAVTSPGQSAAAQKTDFTEITADFAIAEGVARTENVALIGPLVRLTATGAIDLGRQRLDLRATPKAVASLEGQGGSQTLEGVAFPLRIAGPWTNPSITPDLDAGAIESVAALFTDGDGAGAFLKQLEGADVEDVAREIGGDAAQEVLDSVLGGGQGGEGGGVSTEDAVRGVLEGLLGGGQEPAEPKKPEDLLRGIFGN